MNRNSGYNPILSLALWHGVVREKFLSHAFPLFPLPFLYTFKKKTVNHCHSSERYRTHRREDTTQHTVNTQKL